jgi:hypothetical protein
MCDNIQLFFDHHLSSEGAICIRIPEQSDIGKWCVSNHIDKTFLTDVTKKKLFIIQTLYKNKHVSCTGCGCSPAQKST